MLLTYHVLMIARRNDAAAPPPERHDSARVRFGDSVAVVEREEPKLIELRLTERA